MSRASGGQPALGNGTPEQVHLTWGDDPASSVVVCWASPGRALRPRVRIGQRVILATEQAGADPRSADSRGGRTGWTYHARVTGLRPGAAYGYAVTADNDANSADPFTSTFRTAPAGRGPFRFTCSGDLATADSAGAALAAGAVESFQPLFHLLNGGVCGAGPAALRDFGGGSQFSAASRPWMPVAGAHDLESRAAYLARHALPGDGAAASGGRWYSFRVASALFICLDSGDITAAGSIAGDAQTWWLERTLAWARADAPVDWIIVAAHHPACSSAGCYAGVRDAWLPLLDRYRVDLLLAGHGSGYERSFPCRGHDRRSGHLLATGETAETRRPHPVTRTDTGVLDTSLGTVHLSIGHGGRRPGSGSPDPARDMPLPPGSVAVHGLPGGPVAERATWSARRDPEAGYGIAVFDVDPGTEASEQARITVSYYRAGDHQSAGCQPPGDLTEFERFTLVRPRSGTGEASNSGPGPRASADNPFKALFTLMRSRG